MYNPPYDLGLFVGRFQHYHLGHQKVVDQALQICDRLLILIGSSQEVGTLRNPFDSSTRAEMIRACHPDDSRVIIKQLPDLSSPEDITPIWGRHVLQQVHQHTRKLPSVMFYGNDQARSQWFDPLDIKDVDEYIISRYKLNISGTMMRELLLSGEDRRSVDLWHSYTNPKIHKHFDKLRSELVNAEGYKHIVRQLYHRQKAWTDGPSEISKLLK